MAATQPLSSAITRAASSRRRRWPARLDVVQGAAGLALAAFLLVHTFFVGSLLLGPWAFEAVLSVADGSLIFGRPVHALHAVVAATILLLLGIHAALALRKFPEGYRQYRVFRDHVRNMRHADTTLWAWQVVTGFLLFFLATVHVYMMLTQPDRIGPAEAAARIVQGRLWLMYLLLVPVAQFHSFGGVYRLALKWGWFAKGDPAIVRRRLRRVLFPLMGVCMLLGFVTLATEIRIGLERGATQPEPAVPAHVAQGLPT